MWNMIQIESVNSCKSSPFDPCFAMSASCHSEMFGPKEALLRQTPPSQRPPHDEEVPMDEFWEAISLDIHFF